MVRQFAIMFAMLLMASGGCTCSSPATPPATPPDASQSAKPAGTSQPGGSPVGMEGSRDGLAAASGPGGTQPANGERPKLKSRWGRSLADQIDRVDGGTSEERDLIRETLRKNDDTVDRALSNLPGRIEAANNTHDGPRRIAIPAP